MNNEPNHQTLTSRWPEAIAVTLSLVALVVSGIALFSEQEQHQDERLAEALDQIYEDWDELALVDHWEVLHLAEVPETYDRVVSVLREYAASLPRAEQLRVFLLERAVSVKVLVAFEHNLKQLRNAQASGNERRRALLEEEVDFYVDSYLRNPRLLWFFAEDGGGLVLTLDPPSIEFYKDRVLDNPALPLTVEPDPIGILPPDFTPPGQDSPGTH